MKPDLVLFLLFFTVTNAWAAADRCAEALREISSVLVPYELRLDDWAALPTGYPVIIYPGLLPTGPKRPTAPVEMKLVGIKNAPSTSSPQDWEKAGAVLSHPELGNVELPLMRLVGTGKAFLKPEANGDALFRQGQLIRLELDGTEGPEVVFQPAGPGWKRLRVETGNFPWLGAFRGEADKDHYLVEVMFGAKSPTPVHSVVKIPKRFVQGTVSGTAQLVRAALKKIEDLPRPSFQTGDAVRFRNEAGLMQEGSVLETQGAVTVIVANAKHVKVAQNRVFLNHAPASPALTAHFPIDAENLTLSAPRGLVASFLDGAARMASQQDFVSRPAEERLWLLMKYVQLFVPWDSAGVIAERAGVKDYNRLLCYGGAACRQSAELLGAVFSENGYPTKYVYTEGRRVPGGELQSGHAWLEVTLTLEGKAETFIVDPANGIISKRSEIITAAATTPDFARTFANPARIVILPKPILVPE